MAKASKALAELVEKGVQDDVVRGLLGQVVQRLMDFEIEQLLRRGIRRANRGAEQQPQWLPRSAVGNARWLDRSQDTEAAGNGRRDLPPSGR